MSNPNWPRWVKSSIYQHFNALTRTDTALTKLKTDGVIGKVPMQFEGEELDRTNRTGLDKVSNIELKINGPKERALPNGEYRLDVDIHQVIQAVINELYDYERIKGLAQAMHGDFLLYKLGDGAEDDGTSFACLQLLQDQPLDIRDYGRINQDTRILHGTITGRYRAYVTE